MVAHVPRGVSVDLRSVLWAPSAIRNGKEGGWKGDTRGENDIGTKQSANNNNKKKKKKKKKYPEPNYRGGGSGADVSRL